MGGASLVFDNMGVNLVAFTGKAPVPSVVALNRVHNEEIQTQGMIEDGEQLPDLSNLEEIVDDPDYADAAAFLVVSVPDPRPRRIRVNITMPEMTLKQVDAAA